MRVEGPRAVPDAAAAALVVRSPTGAGTAAADPRALPAPSTCSVGPADRPAPDDPPPSGDETVPDVARAGDEEDSDEAHPTRARTATTAAADVARLITRGPERRTGVATSVDSVSSSSDGVATKRSYTVTCCNPPLE
jgi:hypothetical protein